MLCQEDDPELDDKWWTANEQLTRFIKARERIVRRVKELESPYFQGNQSSEEYLGVRESVLIRTERPSVIKPGTIMNHAPVG